MQKPSDVIEARGLIGDRAGVMSKIEKPSALDQIDDIIRLSDAVMVARGDLGVEIPHEEVPGRQKELVRACRLAVKPVIIATQMLDSMVNAPTPTRAEASDVATAIYDGADAVMLSAESASGHYPVEAVAMMDRIIRKTEQHKLYRSILEASEPEVEDTPPHAVAAAAADLARVTGAAAIVAFTSSGTTAARIARKRPEVPILAVTPEEPVSRQPRPALGGPQRSLRQRELVRRHQPARRIARPLGGVRQAGRADHRRFGRPVRAGRHTNNLRVLQMSAAARA